jgi:chromodomain-helicase-DNA-binding protein 1
MNMIPYTGDAALREVVQDFKLGQMPCKIKFNVLLTTYEYILKNKKKLCQIKWQAHG